ncbi:multidrug transporter [Gordoniibacillus kamchatkensis]|uniref:Multidrug transporter n=1 Tax=Gordoniibacillus kamchatkensis TaxID=1590651 RepID=A0ABR5AKY1_9BACL|nr:DMT family transporter [Paenibacillus sp. VKM B-2647]KIL41649.1 multidrug transporter [Paenibacillus sp. VKM B-2647]
MNEKGKAVLLVLLGGASYGVLSTMVKLGYRDGFTVGEITGGQAAAGCLIMWLLRLIIRDRAEIGWATRWKLIGSGVFTGLTGVVYYYSLQMLDASLAVLLLFQFVWMGMAVEWAVHGRRPGRIQWITVAMVLAGTLLASGIAEHSPVSVRLTGVGLGLLAAVCYTAFMYFSGHVAVNVPAVQRSSWMLTGGAAAVLLIYPPQFLWNGSLGHGLWLWALLLSVFGYIIPPYLFAKGAPRIGTGAVAMLGSVELPVVIACSGLFLHEKTSLLQWLGIVVILAGVSANELVHRVQKKDSQTKGTAA